jgi:hypothetical protein
VGSTSHLQNSLLQTIRALASTFKIHINHLIVRAAIDLENRHSYELTVDLGINSDSMPIHSGLKHHPVVIILNHLEEGIE